jgi:hypothetical protein
MYISLGTSVIDWCKSVEVDGGIELRGIFNWPHMTVVNIGDTSPSEGWSSPWLKLLL